METQIGHESGRMTTHNLRFSHKGKAFGTDVIAIYALTTSSESWAQLAAPSSTDESIFGTVSLKNNQLYTEITKLSK